MVWVEQLKRAARALAPMLRDQHTVVLLFVFAVHTTLRARGLTEQSLWFDELCSVTRSAPSLTIADILRILQQDRNPPFFYLLLHAWFGVFGDTETSARLLPFVGGLLGFVSLYALARQVGGRGAALVAVVLLTCNFTHIQYSQEVRVYSFFFFFAGWFAWSFLRLLAAPSWQAGAVHGAFTAAMAYAHYFAPFLVLSEVIFFCVLLGVDFKRHRPLVVPLAIAAAVCGLLFAPWIPTIVAMAGIRDHWPAVPPPDFYLEVWTFLAGRSPASSLFMAALIASLLLRAPKKGPVAVHYLATLIVGVLVTTYWRSHTAAPLAINHYYLCVLPAVLVLAALAIQRMTPLPKALLLCLFVALSAINLFVDQAGAAATAKEPWRQQTVRLATIIGDEQLRATDFVVYSGTRQLHQYYLRDASPPITVTDRPTELRKRIAEDPALKTVFLLEGHFKAKPEIIQMLAASFPTVTTEFDQPRMKIVRYRR